jgi:hypothetical protein
VCFALDRLLDGKYLMVLLYVVPLKHLREVYQLYRAILVAQHANQMLLVTAALHQRTVPLEIGVDNQLETDCLNSPTLARSITVDDPQEALVPKG